MTKEELALSALRKARHHTTWRAANEQPSTTKASPADPSGFHSHFYAPQLRLWQLARERLDSYRGSLTMASVLLCGTDQLLFDLLAERLQATGHDHARCSEAESALELLNEQEHGLLLCDGPPADLRIGELLARLPKRSATMPVLVLKDSEHGAEPPQLGRCRFLRRSACELGELLATINDLLPSESPASTSPGPSGPPAGSGTGEKPTWMKSLGELAADYKKVRRYEDPPEEIP